MSRYRWEAGRIISPLPARAFIEHDDLGTLELTTRAEVYRLAELLDAATPDDKLLRIVTDGTYYTEPEGDLEREERTAAATSQVRALLLGTDTPLAPGLARGHRGPPRWLIRDVWEAGTFPQLSGNSKAGKSVVCLEAIKTLVDPSHLFLGRYERGEIDPADLERGIVYINTENPSAAIDEALAPLALVPFERTDGTIGNALELVTVYHLRDLGGPNLFDPRDPAKFEMWRRELLTCNECEGDDNVSPFLVIADNGTAVLRALGESVQDHIGEWFEALRQLLTEIDTENGIGVAHATMDGKNALGGTISSAASDGEWTYSRRGTSGAAPRFFAISPRLGPVPPLAETRVTREADGRLLLANAAQAVSDTTSAAKKPEDGTEARGDELAASVLADLRGAGGLGLTKTEATGRGRVGKLRREALEGLLEAGLVASERTGNRERYWLSELAPVTVSGARGHSDIES